MISCSTSSNNCLSLGLLNKYTHFTTVHSKSDRAIISTTISQSLDLPLFVCILWESIYWGMPTRQIKNKLRWVTFPQNIHIPSFTLASWHLWFYICLFTKTELLNKTTKPLNNSIIRGSTFITYGQMLQ